jgi:hypothetical protein
VAYIGTSLPRGWGVRTGLTGIASKKDEELFREDTEQLSEGA